MRHSVSVILNKVQIDFSFYSFLFWVLPCAVLETITKFSVKSEMKIYSSNSTPKHKQTATNFLFAGKLASLPLG